MPARPPPRPLAGGPSVSVHPRRHSVVTAPILIGVSVLGVLLALGACSSTASAPASGPASTRGDSTPSPTVTSSVPPSEVIPQPNPSRFSDPSEQLLYELAFSNCQVLGLSGGARAWGGDPGDPDSIARAYAAYAFPNSEEHRGTSFAGCIEALEGQVP